MVRYGTILWRQRNDVVLLHNFDNLEHELGRRNEITPSGLECHLLATLILKVQVLPTPRCYPCLQSFDDQSTPAADVEPSIFGLHGRSSRGRRAIDGRGRPKSGIERSPNAKKIDRLSRLDQST